MKQYSFINQNNRNGVQTISMNSVLKPLSIGSLTKLANENPAFLKQKIAYQLNRIKNLEMDLMSQINDPKYQKTNQKNQIDLKFLKSCNDIHKSYFNKILYYRNKTLTGGDVRYIVRLQNTYKSNLFRLNQEYQKVKLQLKGINVNENPI